MRETGIDGLFNVRATGDPVWLIRTGAPEGITPAGVEELAALGARVVVDLREPDEAGPVAHGLPVVRTPLYGRPAPEAGRLEDVYEGLLRDRGPAIGRAVAAIADADGAAVVHCTAGKDRTGLVVALALAAAGATAEEIEADYVRSGHEVRPVRLGAARAIADAARPADRAEILRLHLESPVAAIAHALDVVGELGGADAFLRDGGVTEAQLASLRRKRAASAGVPA